MKKQIALFVALFSASLSTACVSETPSEPEPTAPAADVAASKTPESTASRAIEKSMIRGYLHTAARTGFRLGTVLRESDEGGVHRVIGEEGVFAVDKATGDARSIPNADAPGLHVPCRLDAEGHNKAVMEYFAGRGIPTEQMTGAHVTTLHQGEGDATKARAATVEGTGFVAYYSIVNRAIEGIPVVESVAWARLNGDGDVVSEEVRWPEVPASVLKDAKAMQETLADPGTAKAFHAMIRLPQNGQVVIHHGTWMGGVRFPAFASYDVMDAPDGQTNSARTRHFLLDGAEVILQPEEIASDAKRR